VLLLLNGDVTTNWCWFPINWQGVCDD